MREGGSRDKTLIKIISPKHTTKPSSSMQSVALSLLGLPPDHLALILHTSSSSRLVFRSPLLLLVNKSSPSPPPHLSFFCSIQFDHKRTLVRSFSCCFLASSSCTLTNSSCYVAGCTTCIHLLFLRVFSLPLCFCAFQFNEQVYVISEVESECSQAVWPTRWIRLYRIDRSVVVVVSYINSTTDHISQTIMQQRQSPCKHPHVVYSRRRRSLKMKRYQIK